MIADNLMNRFASVGKRAGGAQRPETHPPHRNDERSARAETIVRLESPCQIPLPSTST